MEAATAATAATASKKTGNDKRLSPETEEISENVPLRVLDGPPARLDVPQHNGVSPIAKVGQVVQSLVMVRRSRRGCLQRQRLMQGGILTFVR